MEETPAPVRLVRKYTKLKPLRIVLFAPWTLSTLSRFFFVFYSLDNLLSSYSPRDLKGTCLRTTHARPELLCCTNRLQTAPCRHDIAIQEQLIPALKHGQVLVKIAAAAFKDSQGLYPRIAFGSILGADGAGVPSTFNISRRFGRLRGAAFPPLRTFAECVVVDRREVIVTPAHLTDERRGPWRANRVIATAQIAQAPGKHASMLVNGIGGGVALLCRAMGADLREPGENRPRCGARCAQGPCHEREAPGSRADLHATAFLTTHRLVSVVVVLSGLGVEAAEEVFEMIKLGAQFGKIVIRVVDLHGAGSTYRTR
ncbi:hypothetical protein GGX14DRAFT_632479 [Mycena pura]|uniref:Uncharacterized protein n=1 Tax=Mycena pura TaxID=153505 RepID=A0AAD6VDV1_9AGAR|nr:hypothetical protein GGX14DRAFT_632479 [Mycena pura]